MSLYNKSSRAALLLIIAVLLGSCEYKYPKNGTLHEGITRVAEFLYADTCYDYSADAAIRLLSRESLAGACTAVHNGQFVGHNYDGLFDTSAEFIIHVPHSDHRFASVGIAGGIPTFTAEVVESGAESDVYDCLPYFTLDGINEHGVYCGINLLPLEDITPTNNNRPGNTSLHMRMIPRYILDNAATAEEAVSLLSDVNILNTSALPTEAHFLIADSTCSFIVEWINGQMQSLRDSFHILSNYYLLQPMTAHSTGIERAKLAEDFYSQTSTKVGMVKTMHNVRMSRMYDRKLTPFWYSDHNRSDAPAGKETVDLTIDSQPQDYEACLKEAEKQYRTRKRGPESAIRHTKHTAVYDLTAKTATYYVQEAYNHYYEYTVME